MEIKIKCQIESGESIIFKFNPEAKNVFIKRSHKNNSVSRYCLTITDLLKVLEELKAGNHVP